MKHKVLDLFSGIGGFSLGLQNTGGFETVAFCEIEPYCHKVLKKHWQDVPIYNDIKELDYDTLQADGIEPDVITGGFPCQDISVAGPGKGIIGERSSLWSEYARLIKDVRPTWAIIENVSALRSKGLALVLQNLSEIRYNAEWHCIPCTAVGGLHRRDRIWIIAYPMENSRCTLGQRSFIEGKNEDEVGEGNANQYQRSSSTSRDDRRTQGKEEGTVGDSNNSRDRTPQRRAHRVRKEEDERWEGQSQSRSSRSSSTVSNSMCEGLERSRFSTDNGRQDKEGQKGTYGSASKSSGIRGEPKHIVTREQIERVAQYAKTQWAIEPNVGRVAYGIPNRVHRLKGLGNAVVPQIPQFLGESILNFEKENI
jgi:DNA (cytosine-5)-methyltransferase 1